MFAFRYLSLPSAFLAGAALLISAVQLSAQSPVDPGPRPVSTVTKSSTSPKFTSSFTRTVEPSDALGAGGAGALLGGSGNQGGFWADAISVFAAVATVPGGADNIKGLGPAFNGEGCQQCHSFPTVGGTSGQANFQASSGFLHDHGANNTADLTGIISSDGPVREVRFVSDGAVHELFSIQGRDDATGCTLPQPDFQSQLTAGNLIFRIPTPLFGLGFVENTPDATLQETLENAQSYSANLFNPSLGIGGHFNTNGNDGTISRFGWKAQNKSLLLFAGEAANVELGVTNELFQNEKVIGNNCTNNQLPEDITVVLDNTDTALQNGTSATAKIASDIQNFAIFMRLNAAAGECAFNSPAGQCFSLFEVQTNGQNDQSAVDSIQRGKALFGTIVAGATPNPDVGIGCVLCHTDVLNTGPGFFPGLDSKPFRPFSDFALHEMDPSLADGVSQGTAAGDEFRTAPLWGIGQRLFFLHDGRARDLLTAIIDHAPTATTVSSSCTTTGEACQSIVLFNQLPPVTPAGTITPSQQDILNFLRSL